GPSPAATVTSFGTTRRTYRLAVAATGEYTAAHGGNVLSALAGIATTVNRVTGIYEREVGIRLRLVDNETSLIFTDPITDPYTNGEAGTMQTQNQATVDRLIGSANYDFGHVFGTGAGGRAAIG